MKKYLKLGIGCMILLAISSLFIISSAAAKKKVCEFCGSENIYLVSVDYSDCHYIEGAYSCLDCKKEFTYYKLDSKEHIIARDVYVEPTCLRVGGIEHHCINCSYYVFEKTAPALGHNYIHSEKQMYSKAACAKNERYYLYCSRCGIRADHDPQLKDKGVDAWTWEKQGTALPHGEPQKIISPEALRTARTDTQPATFYYTCSVCNKPIKDGNYFTGSLKVNIGEMFAGDIFAFGSYPQSEVKDKSLLAELASVQVSLKNYGFKDIHNPLGAPADISYGDFEWQGVKYRKVVMNEARPRNIIGDADNMQASFKTGTYYFKFEPLYWKVVYPHYRAGYAQAVCLNVIDFRSYLVNEDIKENVNQSVRFNELYYQVLPDGDNYFNGNIYTGDLKALCYNDYDLLTYTVSLSAANVLQQKQWLDNTLFNDVFNAAQQSFIYKKDIGTLKYDTLNRNYNISLIDPLRHFRFRKLVAVMAENGSVAAPVSDYALCLRPDYSDNPITADDGLIYKADGVYAQALCFRGMSGYNPQNEGEKEYFRSYEQALYFAPFYGMRPLINIKTDYEPEVYSTIAYSTTDTYKSTAGRVFDVNGDKVIDISDISAVIANLGTNVVEGENDELDVNFDNAVSVTDMSEILQEDRFGKSVN